MISWKVFKIVIYLTELGLSGSIWDRVPQPGIEPGPSALGNSESSHWTTRDIP